MKLVYENSGNITCEISGDTFIEFLVKVEEKYNISLKSNLNSNLDEVIDEIEAITDLVKRCKTFIDYDNFWIFEQLYKIFYIENSEFYKNSIEGYQDFVRNEFKRAYIRSCSKDVPDSRDFFGDVSNLNTQLSVALAVLRFEIFYQNIIQNNLSSNDIVKEIKREFNIFDDQYDNKEDLLDCYTRDVEESSQNYNGIYFNEFELYSELNIGCLSFDADSLECFSQSFKNPRAAEILAEIFYEEEKAHIGKGKGSLIRCYYGQDQIIINPELLVDGCYCVSNKSHHSLYVYEDYVKERQKAIGGE